MSTNRHINPLSLQSQLYKRYSSSQTYFYTNMINEIVKEKRTTANIFYEDIEYLLDMQQNLKRWYEGKQFNSKMFTFKQYYFYHEDCPRIFMKGIEDAYAKWQDKKRDLVYKRLKLIYKESYSSDQSQIDDQKSQNYVATTHFLLEISDYNPFSKKYYLRVQAKKQKERKRLEEEKRHQSRRDMECLNHQLSAMLNDMSTLSEISTLSKNTPIKIEKVHQKSKIRAHLKDKSEDKSKSKSTNLSNSNSIITFNFKKNKQSVERLKNVKDPKKLVIKDVGKQKDMFPEGGRISPKFISNQGENNFLKSKSIFSVSSFGALHKNTEIKSNGRYDQFKINLDSKKLTLDDRKYDTEKKKNSLPKNIVIKTKSTSKFEKRPSLEKLPSRESSAGRLPRADQFSDKKLSKDHHKNGQFQFRSRSMKSEYLTIATTKKPIFNVKHPLELTKGKKALELRNW